MYKLHEHRLPWTGRVYWCWPAGDKKLLQVFDHVADIDAFMPHIDSAGVCIQAGGACGVWPLRYSQLFDHVHTFEPQPQNYYCLIDNIQGVGNITAYNAPLANDHKAYAVHNDMAERENCGAGYIVPDQSGLAAMRIDDLSLTGCDLIQLDVEGYELDALKGGADTIARYRPVIVLEEKPLGHMAGDPARARKWLEAEFGYRQVGSVHRDVILKC